MVFDDRLWDDHMPHRVKGRIIKGEKNPVEQLDAWDIFTHVSGHAIAVSNIKSALETTQEE